MLNLNEEALLSDENDIEMKKHKKKKEIHCQHCSIILCIYV